MDLTLWDGFKVLPAQLQAANPVLVMLLIPFAGKVAVSDRRAPRLPADAAAPDDGGHGAGVAGDRGASR